MRSRGWGSNPIDWCPYERKRHPETSPLSCKEERPWEKAARRWWSTSHKEKSHQKPALLAPWSWPSSLQNCKKINVCCLSNPVCGISYGSPSWLIQMSKICQIDRHMDLKFRRKSQVRDINLGITIREMVFKVVRLDEITSGVSVTEMRLWQRNRPWDPSYVQTLGRRNRINKDWEVASETGQQENKRSGESNEGRVLREREWSSMSSTAAKMNKARIED